MRNTLSPQRSINLGGMKFLLLSLMLALALMSSLPSPYVAFADDEDENVVQVSSGAELNEALSTAVAGTTIKLTADIDAVTSATYTGNTLTIDGNGYTIDGKGETNTTIRFTGTSNITLKNVTIQNCVGNIRYGGGGFAIWRGTLAVENSAFINNTCLQGDGGGILVDNGTTSITNCTFYGNTAAASGGAASIAGIGTITNCTIVGNTAGTNGGAIYNNARTAESTTTVFNSIILGNSATTGNDIYKFADGGTNIIGAVEEASITDPTTVYGTSLEDAALWLDGAPALNDYSIPTIALLEVEGSLAIDTANAEFAPETDLRGIARDDAPDIGSFELVKSGGQEQVDVLTLSSADAYLITNGDYVNVVTEFTAPVNSNTAIIQYSFDTSLFSYADFHPANGVTVISKKATDDGARIIVMIPDYQTQVYGKLAIQAKADAIMTNGWTTLSAQASYIVKDESGAKSTKSADASLYFTTIGNGSTEPAIKGDTNGDGIIDLLDLSNMIDWFGTNNTNAEWDSFYTYFDFDNSGDINISDISFVASKIS